MLEHWDYIIFPELTIPFFSVGAFSCFQSDAVIKTKAPDVHIWEVILSDFCSQRLGCQSKQPCDWL